MLRVAVVGAGIGGLACAAALGEAGHRVDVFERSAELKEVDSGLTLWPNGTLALRRLGALDALRRRCASIARLHLRRWDGRALMAIPTERFATSAVGVHRADLHAALLARVPKASVHLGAECRSVEQTADEVVLSGAGGGAYDLVVAADGVRSVFRAYVGAEDTPRYLGYTVYRGVAEAARAPLPSGVMTEIWGRGLRFGLFAIGAGRWCWYAAVTRPEGGILPQARRREILLSAFASWSESVRAIVAATPEILQNDAYVRAPVPVWSRGRVVLVGDAAHPMPPNLGQGACLTLEDAVVLQRVLDAERDVPAALSRFESTRRRRVYGIAGRSRRIGALAQWENPMLVRWRDELTRRVPGFWLTRTSRAIHSYGSAKGPSRHPRRLGADD